MATRTLVAVLVHGGRDYVPACLESAGGLTGLGADVGVLVLDDASPDEGWSAEVRDRCAALGLEYYRSPRNLGIPRNMNLALRWADARGYDHVVLANSDVIFPATLVPGLVAAAAQDPEIASVTAWSNSVSVFSLPNADARANLATREVVDRVSGCLHDHFGARVVDLPVGVGFCMLVPTAVVRRVGLLDPVFGRGYCEEVDWCLRATTMGYRHVLAPGVFVYHIGGASSREVGLLQAAQTSDPANDALIDHRYPHYRRVLREHDERGSIERVREEGARVLVLGAARERGYVVEASGLDPLDAGPAPRFVVDPAQPEVAVRAVHGGFEGAVDIDDGDVIATLQRAVGRLPERVVLRDRGPAGDRLDEAARAAGVPVEDRYAYPQVV